MEKCGYSPILPMAAARKSAPFFKRENPPPRRIADRKSSRPPPSGAVTPDADDSLEFPHNVKGAAIKRARTNQNQVSSPQKCCKRVLGNIKLAG